jgi:hypothetical protein
MLFAIIYRLAPSQSEADKRQLRRRFIAWEPPGGIEIKSHYFFVQSGGIVMVEAATAGAIWEAAAPFVPQLDMQIEPVISIAEALAISIDADDWADTIT